jgi:eukaryotic-like serine/threonine-protein kinase
MNPERWQQIDRVFQAAVQLRPAQRAAFLNEVCTGDEALHSRVEAMLASDDRGWDLIEKPAFEVAAPLLSDDQPQLTPDQRLGHYQIVNLIGRGGMGEVYLAVDQLLNRKIALKLLPADYTRDKERLRRFQQEAQAASALNHPNILTIYELREVDRRQFIATEFVEGETLRQRLKRAPLTLPETLEIAIQIASALSAAHRAGIVHRDIKPENVMLRPDGYVKVLDFGLAKLTEQHERAPDVHAADRLDISSGLVMGTVKYMSPEQTRGSSVDARSDIFSFGILIYEMVARRHPFAGETTSKLIAAISEEEPPQLTQSSPDAPKELQHIITRSLRKDKQERYQTVEDLLLDLKKLEERLELETKLHGAELGVNQSALNVSNAQSAALTGKVEAIDTAPSIQDVAAEIRRHKTRAILILAAFAISAVAVSFGLYRFSKLRSARTPFQNMMVTRLTTSGHAAKPVISPNGKYVLYGNQEDEKVSLWLREIGTNSESQILPPTEGTFGGAAFSPDGQNVYYIISMHPLAPYDFAVYQLPVSGGTGTRLPINVSERVSVSPDGKHLAYIRADTNLQESSLRTANADGTDERVILKRQRPYDIVYASWSPERKSIAYARFTASGKGRIFEVDVASGTETPVSQQEWGAIRGLVWLSDMSGLILVASSEALGPNQIWHLPYPTGEAQKLTNDTNSYQGISVSSDGHTMVTEQLEHQSRIWTVPVDPNHPLVLDMNRAKQLSANRFEGSHGLSFTPNGQIVYSSEEGGTFSIWIVDTDGGNRKHLYDNGGDPVASPDGRYIVFTSLTGELHIWRMDLDGGNLSQLTTGRGENAPSFSPDGKWVVYNSYESGQPTVWKVSIEGGAPVQITSTQSDTPWFSPDGKLIAYGYFAENDEPRISLIPSEGGEPIKTFVLPGSYLTLEWTPDGKAVTFLVRGRNGPGNIWAQPIAGGPPRQLTNFTTDRLVNDTWSRDGKQVAFVRATQVSDVVLISDLK